MRKLKIEFTSAKQTNVPKIFYVHLLYMVFLLLENYPFKGLEVVHRKSNGEQKLYTFLGFILSCNNEATMENGGLSNAVYYSGLGLAG